MVDHDGGPFASGESDGFDLVTFATVQRTDEVGAESLKNRPTRSRGNHGRGYIAGGRVKSIRSMSFHWMYSGRARPSTKISMPAFPPQIEVRFRIGTPRRTTGRILYIAKLCKLTVAARKVSRQSSFYCIFRLSASVTVHRCSS